MFKLRLRRDTSIFANDADFDDSGVFHPSNLYEGELHGILSIVLVSSIQAFQSQISGK